MLGRNRPPAGWHKHPTSCLLHPQPSDSRAQDHLSHETLGFQGQPGTLLPPPIVSHHLCPVHCQDWLSLVCCSTQHLHLPCLKPSLSISPTCLHDSLGYQCDLGVTSIPTAVWLAGASLSTLSSKSSTTTHMSSFHQSSLLQKSQVPTSSV